MAQSRSPLRPGMMLSAAFHCAAALLLVIWGAGVPVPQIQPPVDFVMVDLPQGPSEELGLGTTEDGEENLAQVATTTTPPPKDVQEKLTDLIKRMELDKQAPEVAKQEPELAEPKASKTPPPAKKDISKPATPAAQKPSTTATTPPKPLSQKEQLLATMKKLDRTNQPGMKGQNSPGWKEGTSGVPLKTIPIGAILQHYRAQVRTRILQQWQKPAQLSALPPAKRPSATLTVRISPSGQITGTSWSKRSGNELLDGSALRAVNRANPLPTPPAEIRDHVMREQFVVTFKP